MYTYFKNHSQRENYRGWRRHYWTMIFLNEKEKTSGEVILDINMRSLRTSAVSQVVSQAVPGE